MKNIHILPTDKPSRLVKNNLGLIRVTDNFTKSDLDFILAEFVNIYVTSDEKIKDVRPHKGKWQLETGQILNKFPNYLTDLSECKLVIMTTDQNLIKDGVQAIDDEFLKWFVKNPSCEEVEVVKEQYHQFVGIKKLPLIPNYKIIIPKEEIKLEDVFNDEKIEGVKKLIHEVKSIPAEETTLEEIANEYSKKNYSIDNGYCEEDYYISFLSFRDGAKWQQERSYSEEDVKNAFLDGWQLRDGDLPFPKAKKKWFNKFKNKNDELG